MLVDTARYYFSPDFIKHIVDALSYNKFNVLHWHLTDAQSFPLQVDTFPQLAEQGAFPPNSFFCRKDKCNYTHDDVRSIVSYAKARGVRVVPEFDTPGHSYAWGLGYPNSKNTFEKTFLFHSLCAFLISHGVRMLRSNPFQQR